MNRLFVLLAAWWPCAVALAPIVAVFVAMLICWWGC